MEQFSFKTNFVVLLFILTSCLLKETDTAYLNEGNGHHHRQPRIFGGSLVPRDEIFPYQVYLSTRGGSFFCGGAILEPYVILTAAHCILDQTPGQVEVTAGTKYRNPNAQSLEEYADPQIRQASDFYIHKNYDNIKTQNDIAIILLKTPLHFNHHVNKIDLPSRDDVFINGSLTVTGWGQIVEEGEFPQVLKKATFPIVDNLDCEALWGYRAIITDDMLCAGSRQSTGSGDSGSAAVCTRDDSTTVLCGIVSFSAYQADQLPSIIPAVFTKVVNYLDWIEDKLKKISSRIFCNENNFYCPSSQKCIPRTFLCDGESNCEEGEDEVNCITLNDCRTGQFICGNGRCTPEQYRCDGRADCEDGSDEDKCGAAVEQCEGLHYCGNKDRCIPMDWKCDGLVDCNNESDEDGCHSSLYGLDSYDEKGMRVNETGKARKFFQKVKSAIKRFFSG